MGTCFSVGEAEEEGDGENLFGDEMENDYRANPELDRSESRCEPIGRSEGI